MAPSDAGYPMVVGEAMIIAGIGCRKGTPAAEIETAVSAALAQAGLDRAAIGMLATSAAKEGEPGIVGAAAALQTLGFLAFALIREAYTSREPSPMAK